MHEKRTDVLVVGAGPVGLWTALLLARAGLETVVVDRESTTAARSYACALHPKTLELLDSAGLAETLVGRGRRIPRIGFYEGQARKALLDLGASSSRFPFLLVLPQNVLESTLETHLRQAGVAVEWSRRFDAYTEENEEIAAVVEDLEGTSTGYIVPHWEMVVKSRSLIRARYLVGCDGFNSLVRRRASIDKQRVTGPELFAAFEFVSDRTGDDEIKVVMDPVTTNLLWPLLENRFRWTFQINLGEMEAEFPEKERRRTRVWQASEDERIREYVKRVAAKRAPWFDAPVKEIAWCTEVPFEHCMATQFGRGRAWLAGDAAHQTGPGGVQSMNSGFLEAVSLVQAIKSENPAALADHDQAQAARWRQLLGLTGGLKPTAGTEDWLRQRAQRLLPCLPGAGEELKRLANQLRFEIS